MSTYLIPIFMGNIRFLMSFFINPSVFPESLR